MALDRLSNITRSGLGSVHTYDVGGVISTGVITATSFSGAGATFTGNVSIGGILTYEDVTNIDSVGLITARNGLHVTGGSVGIGTDNPLRKLDILGTGRPVEIGSTNATNIVKLYNSATGRSTYNGVDIQSNSTAGGIIGAYGGYLDLRTSSSNGSDATSRLRITSDGKIGINQDTPTADLEVAGTIGTASTIFINAPTHSSAKISEAVLKFGYAHSGSPDAVAEIKLVEGSTNSFGGYLSFSVPSNNGSGGSSTSEALRIASTGCLQVGEPSGTPAEVMQIRKASSDTEIITYANTGYKSIFNCTGSNRFALERGGQSIFEIQDPNGNGVRGDLRFDGNIILNHNIGETNNSAVQAYRLIGCSNLSLASGMVIVGNQTDTMSTKAARIMTSNNSGTAFFGPYGVIFPGSYTAMFHMKVSNNSNTSTFLRLDVHGNGITEAGGYGDHRPKVLNLAPSHFDAADRYQYIGLDFNAVNPVGTNVLEVRGLNYNNGMSADLYLDHILIVPRIPSHDG